MNELKAGHKPPPQPGEIQSRPPAPSSRTRERRAERTQPANQQNLPAAETTSLATEQHTNYDSLLRIVREELDNTIFIVPDNPYAHNTEPVTVAIASGNSIKDKAMAQLLAPHEVSIHRVPEAQENHSLNPVTDALSKAKDAVKHIHESTDDKRRAIRQQPFLTIANDVLNVVPTIAKNEQTGRDAITLQRLGKPSNRTHEDGTPYTLAQQVESVRQTFLTLAHLAEKNVWNHIPYLAEIATVIHNPQQPNNNAISTQRVAVFLPREIISYIATPLGFAEYLYRVGEQNFDMINIAAGIELQTLQAMAQEKGMTLFVTDRASDLESPAFSPQRQEAQECARRIAFGHADERLIAAYFGTKQPKEE